MLFHTSLYLGDIFLGQIIDMLQFAYAIMWPTDLGLEIYT